MKKTGSVLAVTLALVSTLFMTALPAHADQSNGWNLNVDGNVVANTDVDMWRVGSSEAKADVTVRDRYGDGHAVFVQMRLQFKMCAAVCGPWVTHDTDRVTDDNGADNGGVTARLRVEADPSAVHSKARVQFALCRDESWSGDPCEEWNSNVWDL